MNFLTKMERKFGKYAIRNLPIVIVICFAIGYLLVQFFPSVYANLYFSPYDIIVGHEYWRLFTWVFSPPEAFSFLSLIMLFFYYMFGQAIERGIGTFMFNVYILGGWLLTTLACFGTSLYFYFHFGNNEMFWIWSQLNGGFEMMTYMMYSLFLGFALVYSDSMVLFMFIIPVKASWIAYIDMVFLAYRFVSIDIALSRASIVAYLVNFCILYLLLQSRIKRRRATRSQHKNQQNYRQQVIDFETARRAQNGDNRTQNASKHSGQNPVTITRHKCAVCGRSELDDPNLEFRFCSKCNGNYEYCSEHLYTHEHVK
ncbi:MAG: hypothetical protein Q4D54_08850 [Eubacteriales bacterium]|nr:hypothetical protein [Lachnospiraceae bacterium]MDO5127841.1 hypothetical protein [Eubacteriales bacterium]